MKLIPKIDIINKGKSSRGRIILGGLFCIIIGVSLLVTVLSGAWLKLSGESAPLIINLSELESLIEDAETDGDAELIEEEPEDESEETDDSLSDETEKEFEDEIDKDSEEIHNDDIDADEDNTDIKVNHSGRSGIMDRLGNELDSMVDSDELEGEAQIDEETESVDDAEADSEHDTSDGSDSGEDAEVYEVWGNNYEVWSYDDVLDIGDGD